MNWYIYVKSPTLDERWSEDMFISGVILTLQADYIGLSEAQPKF
jgi:hypothetical protein